MTNQNPYLQDVFLQPPLVSFKRRKNLKDKLVRAKVSKDIKIKTNRSLKGMKKCGFQCTAFPYINETKEIYSSTWKWNITKDVDCETSNCVYMIECQKKHIANKNILGKQIEN